MSSNKIRLGHSCAEDAREAAAEFHAAVAQPGMELVLFFCSSEYDLEVLAEEINHLFTGIQVVGCTTAGEIGPAGYRSRSLSGASFPAGCCVVANGVLRNLSQFHVHGGYDFVQSLLQRLENRAPEADPGNSIAFLLIDAMSRREEPVAHALQYALGKIPLLGGSAGDDLHFVKSDVFADGHFQSDSAVLILLSTPLPFTIFKTQHFIPTDERLVVTEADPAGRIVKEINGLPAAEEYARLVGIDVHELNARSFAASPVVVMIDGTDYVRSIQKVNNDGSLSFYCAIEEGLVLRVAKGVDFVHNLEEAYVRIQNEIGPPQAVFSFDCVLRNLEITQNCLKNRVGEIFMRNNTVGFSSYGEQFRGVHINQTLTGCAIGFPSDASSEVDDA